MRTNLKMFPIVLFFLLAGCKSDPGGPPVHLADGSIQHRGFGLIFPPQVGKFYRASFNERDRLGENIAAGYSLASPTPVLVMVYVYRGPQGDTALAKQGLEFDNACKELSNTHKDAKMIRRDENNTVINDLGRYGDRAVFEYSALFAGNEQQVESQLLLFLSDGWYVKYRVTYPSDDRKSANEAFHQFFRDLQWPPNRKSIPDLGG